MRSFLIGIIYKIYQIRIRHSIKSFRKAFVKVMIKDNKEYAFKLLNNLSPKDIGTIFYTSYNGYNYLAKNKSGKIFAYTDCPHRVIETWQTSEGRQTEIEADLPFLTFDTEPLYINLRNIEADYYKELINSKKNKTDITDFFNERQEQKASMKAYKEIFGGEEK